MPERLPRTHVLGRPPPGFTALGNVAFDLHDYFGARWGGGLNADPSSPPYQESLESLFDFTLTPGNPHYIGTTLGQERFMQTFLDVLDPIGVPLLIGEFGGRGELEPNVMTLFATMTRAFNATGVSWAAQSYNGEYSVYDDEGNLEPWVSVLSDAAGHRV
jgi:hypothetical protein